MVEKPKLAPPRFPDDPPHWLLASQRLLDLKNYEITTKHYKDLVQRDFDVWAQIMFPKSGGDGLK